MKKTVTLGRQDTIKVSLTTKEGSKAKRPHQAFLIVREASGLETSFPLTVKESGKGSVHIVCPTAPYRARSQLMRTKTQKDLPVQLLLSQSPLEAKLIVASSGSTKGSVMPLFDIALQLDANNPSASHEAPLRYGKLPEIHHIFRADPTNPPKIVSLVFSLAVLATVPALFVGVRQTSTLSG